MRCAIDVSHLHRNAFVRAIRARVDDLSGAIACTHKRITKHSVK